MYEKTVDELQRNVIVQNENILGTLHYVDDYEGFSDDVNLQKGNYLALAIDADESNTVKTEVVNGVAGEVTLPPEERWVVYRLTDKNKQKIKISVTNDKGITNTKTYSLSDMKFECPKGEAAFDKTKTDYGAYGNNDAYYDGSLTMTWTGVNCKVKGKLKEVSNSLYTKLPSDGYYFAFKLDDYFKNKGINVTNTSNKYVVDTDWVCQVGAAKNPITVKFDGKVLAVFDLSEVEFVS